MQISLRTTLVLPGLEVPAGTHTIPEIYREQVEKFAAQNPTLASVLDEATPSNLAAEAAPKAPDAAEEPQK